MAHPDSLAFMVVTPPPSPHVNFYQMHEQDKQQELVSSYILHYEWNVKCSRQHDQCILLYMLQFQKID